MTVFKIAAVAALFVSGAFQAEAQVWVNGQKLTFQQVAWLSLYTCGPVRPGRYWVDPEDGSWGLEDARPLGSLRDRCSERRRNAAADMPLRGSFLAPNGMSR